MRKKQVKYRAIFLVFLLTLGEIHASNGYIKYNSFLTGLKRRSIKNNIEAPRTKREVSEIKDEVVEGTAVSESRKKRSGLSIGVTIIVGVAMTTSLTVEIVATVSDCCALAGFEHLCDKEDKFYKLSSEVDDLSESIDAIWTNANNLVAYLSKTNTIIEEMWLKMQAVDNETVQVINAMDESVEASAGLISEELAAEIEELNETIADLNDYNFKYDTVFDNLADDLWRIHGFITMPITAGLRYLWSTYWQRVFIQELYNNGWYINGQQLQSTSAISAGVSLKAYFKNSQLGQNINAFVNKYSAATWARIKDAAIILVGVINVAIEAWNIIKTVDRCKDLEKEIDNALSKVKSAKATAIELKDDVSEVEANITITYAELVSQLTTDAVEEYMIKVQSYAKESAEYSSSPTMSANVAAIQAFIDGIDAAASSNKEATISLITAVNEALASLGVTFQCYEAKYNTLNYVVNSCQEGSSKSLDELTEDKLASTNDLCGSDEYLDKDDIIAIAKEKLETLNYATECPANSKDVSDNVCYGWQSGLSNEKIASEYKYSLKVVEIVVTHCERGSVTDEIKKQICLYREAANTLAEIKAMYVRLKEAEVTSAFEACPAPTLSTEKEDEICTLKTTKTLAFIKSAYELYDSDAVEEAYYKCPILDSHKEMLCMIRKLEAAGHNVSTLLVTYNNLYTEAKVNAYYETCPEQDMITIEDTNKLQKLHNDDKTLQMLKSTFQKQSDAEYRKSSPSEISNTDVDDSRNKNKAKENYEEVDTFIGLPHNEKRKVIPEVMSRFSEDNNQQLKDMIRESTETRRQRILKKLKDRIASSLFTP